MRTAGILLPISSLPSKYGIGTFSKEAYDFVDFLDRAGQHYWQILPLGPTGYGDSPYQSFSTFAGNPYFIDLDEFVEQGWLTEEEILSRKSVSHPEYVEYELIYLTRFELLRMAYDRAVERGFFNGNQEYNTFCAQNSFWLDNYALYMSIKNAMGGVSWIEWDEPLRMHETDALEEFRREHGSDIGFYYFQQFFFRKQWLKLKKYANDKNIEFIGDIPIYVAFDSADTWSEPELFQLNDEKLPTGVAGCPPDYFAAKGQLWGNPLYDWDYHKETGYDWWMHRLAYQYTLYDVVRIDHFRGFEAYYSIPYGDETAEFGHWEKGPNFDFFRTMKERLGDPRVIAEDLGLLTQEVLDLVTETGYPGMKVLQFAFSASGGSDYLPHNIVKNSVVYPGTHDNDTVRGWYESQNEYDKKFTDDYLGITEDTPVNMALIRAALNSVANWCIVPMQDYLGLGSEARINTPSTLGDNWKWRLAKGALTEELADEIARLSFVSQRLNRE